MVNIDNYTQSVEVEECDDAAISEDFGRERHVRPITGVTIDFQSQDGQDYGVCLYSGAAGNDPDLTVCRQVSVWPSKQRPMNSLHPLID